MMAKRYGWMMLLVWLGAANAAEPDSYPSVVGDKLLRGSSNIAYGWMEIPKNMVNEVNRHNALYAPLGLVKGLAYMAGRAVIGVADLATFPLPTPPLATPPRVWDSTGTETRFFDLGEQPAP